MVVLSMRISLVVSFVVLLSKVLLLDEEAVFSVLLSSATLGEERPPVLSREEVNERE